MIKSRIAVFGTSNFSGQMSHIGEYVYEYDQYHITQLSCIEDLFNPNKLHNTSPLYSVVSSIGNNKCIDIHTMSRIGITGLNYDELNTLDYVGYVR